jgi:hypothetical protein
MSQAASQWAAFVRQVAQTRKVWTIRDEGGFPQPAEESGVRSQPFWSSLSRVEKIIKNVPAYSGFRPVELSWEDFRDRWLPGLQCDGVLVGVNWSGKLATGYDMAPEVVRQRIEFEMDQLSESC